MNDRSRWWRLLYRMPLMILHALIGTPLTVLCQFAPGHALRLGNRSLSEIMLTWWAATVCRIFGLERRVQGALQPGAQLVAANHISWLDIPLLQSVAFVGFVAKAEIGRWPIIGWMARVGGTVFHQRGSHDSASGVREVMAARLAEGQRVAIFPEGGILPGNDIKRFHARLFGAAIDTGTPIQPIMLRYHHGGRPCDNIRFRSGESFPANFFRLLSQPRCIADIHVLPPLDSAGRKRRQLATEAEETVRIAFESELPGD